MISTYSYSPQPISFVSSAYKKVETTNQGHLERRCLKAHIATWRVREHEPKINVDEVSVAVNKDVAIVPVFDLEKVSDDGVS